MLKTDQTFNSRIQITGTVHLVLMDGCTLTASDGIQVEPFGYERNDCRVVR